MATSELARVPARATRQGYDTAALSLLAEAQPLFKTAGLRHEEALVWERLAGLTASTGRPLSRVLDYAEQAVKLARETDDPKAEARALNTLAVVETRSESYPRGLEMLQAARCMSRGQGDVLTEAAAIANLAGSTGIRGGFERGEPRAGGAVTRAADRKSPRPRPPAARERADAIPPGLAGSGRGSRAALARAPRGARLGRSIARAGCGLRSGEVPLFHHRPSAPDRGEVDAMRALAYSRVIEDGEGEAAALALLGGFSHPLLRPELAAEYLALAQAKARAEGYLNVLVESLQLLGDMAPNAERGLCILEEVGALRHQAGDLRGEVKTLSDMCRLHFGLRQPELASERCREAAAVLERYMSERARDPFTEDIRQSFLVSLKSLVTARTELPYLEGYLAIRNLTVIRDPTWHEEPR